MFCSMVGHTMKILFATRTDGADAWFRAVAPASMMRYNGMDVEARAFRGGDPDEFDAIVLQRHCDPVAELMAREFKNKGKPVIYDCDDWLFGMPLLAWAFAMVGTILGLWLIRSISRHDRLS